MLYPVPTQALHLALKLINRIKRVLCKLEGMVSSTCTYVYFDNMFVQFQTLRNVELL